MGSLGQLRMNPEQSKTEILLYERNLPKVSFTTPLFVIQTDLVAVSLAES